MKTYKIVPEFDFWLILVISLICAFTLSGEKINEFLVFLTVFTVFSVRSIMGMKIIEEDEEKKESSKEQ